MYPARVFRNPPDIYSLMSVRKSFSILLILCLATVSTSCVNIVEKLFFKKDGSGSYAMTISIPEGDSFGSGIPRQTKGKETQLTSEFTRKMERVEQRFARIEGISNFDIHVNNETYITGIRFDFANIDALNQALYLYYEPALKGEPRENDKVFFEKKGKRTFIRKNRDILSTFLSKVFLEKDEGRLKPMLLMKDAEAESTIVFERPVKENSNSDYKALDKYTLRWKKYLYTKRHEDKEIGLSVTTK